MVIERAVEPGAEVAVSVVVVEAAAIPVSAVETYAEVAETVVDATIVADCAAPASGVPEIAATAPSPPAGGPESVNIGRIDPGAIDPDIGAAVPGPVAWGPDVTVARDDGLFVDRDRRRRDAYLYRYLGVRGRGR